MKEDLIYLAGPFFSDKQKDIIEKTAAIINANNFRVYNPMVECLYEKGVTKPIDIFEDNVKQIELSDAVVVITDGKDVGTLFEAGFAYGVKTKIIYLWLDSNGAKFNIMLKESAAAVCLSYENLNYTLNELYTNGEFVNHPQLDNMELE